MKLSKSEVANICDMVAPYTMVCRAGVEFTVRQAVDAVDYGGDMVECGVWRGGCGLAMLLAQREAFGRVERKVHFFDTFSGLPLVDPRRDGAAAIEWQRDTKDNCEASRDEVERMLRKFHFKPTEYAIWQGLFENTIPAFLREERPSHIALLRLDGDWYSSTMTCLTKLVPHVREGSTIIVDDYYAWDGCARAVHDYMSDRDLPWRIKSLPRNTGAYIIRESIQ